MFQNVIILNMKAMTLLGEISSASFYTLNIVDYSLSGITMLTLTLNMADIFYRTGRQSDVGLLVQRRNFLYAFIALWLWCGGVICLPPTTMVTLVYHGENCNAVYFSWVQCGEIMGEIQFILFKLDTVR